jgi:putative modified peptide
MTTRFSLDVARALLGKLATDDDFRARFQRDARSALREVGHETPAADHGHEARDPVMHVQDLAGGLASKEKIAQNSDAMLASMSLADVSARAFGPFDLCA